MFFSHFVWKNLSDLEPWPKPHPAPLEELERWIRAALNALLGEWELIPAARFKVLWKLSHTESYWHPWSWNVLKNARLSTYIWPYNVSVCVRACVCVSAVNSSWTTLCLSTANLLCSNGALSSIQGVDVFRSLSAGLTGARGCLQPPSREVSQLDMHPPPPHPTHTWKRIKTDICTNVASHTNWISFSFTLS